MGLRNVILAGEVIPDIIWKRPPTQAVNIALMIYGHLVSA